MRWAISTMKLIDARPSEEASETAAGGSWVGRAGGPHLQTLGQILAEARSTELASRFLAGPAASVRLDAVAGGSCLAGHAGELRGRSALIFTSDQLHSALALLELDGVAGRIILCPPDLATEHLPLVIELGEADAVVSDRPADEPAFTGLQSCSVSSAVATVESKPTPECQTEWVLLTSGTTGLPKLVVHTLASLAGAIEVNTRASKVVWSTFYDIRRYGGLQIFLRSILTGASLVLSDARESTAEFLVRAGASGVTHISGTPSHWRRALMSQSAPAVSPEYVRLSGEIADQAILNNLQSAYSQARVEHAFASTEAGLAFEVNDRLEGFPASLIGGRGEIEMKVENGSLRIRSPRIAARYLGNEKLADGDGFVDTCDMVELRGGRYYFAGRRDGVINIGGMKVHPEEVEAVINRHPKVRMSLVYTRKNPIMGAIVAADVVLEPGTGSSKAKRDELKNEIHQLCRKELPPHKVPAAIKFVAALNVAETGKIKRTPCAT
jgi:acyl-coenzyme A synthetase/AMP-(fatty) acid ligase